METVIVDDLQSCRIAKPPLFMRFLRDFSVYFIKEKIYVKYK